MNTMTDSNAYYNAIACEYGAHMQADARNDMIRIMVADYFKSVVKGKYVMDFGGGTGADLAWLLKSGYMVTFCEPSIGMRREAEAVYANEKVTFADDSQVDFRQWDSTTFPEKVDAILANFCVFNQINDIALLFAKLNETLKDSGDIIALLLDTSPKGIWQHYMKNFIKSVFKGGTPILTIQHSGNKQTVYLHTPRRIKNAIPSGLSLVKIMPMGKPGFMLLHLKK